jgi:hypothetical protein
MNPRRKMEYASKMTPVRDRTTNWSSCSASLCMRGSLVIWGVVALLTPEA